jgi:hypothetical protein
MTISLERFEAVASALSELADTGNAVVLVSRPYTPSLVQIEFDEQDSQVKKVIEQSGLDANDFEAGTDAVARALTVSVEEYGPATLARQEANQNDNKSEVTEEARADASKKLSIVAEHFDIEALRARAWLKKTTKHDILLDRSWEVVRKEADSDTNCPADGSLIPMGVLRLSSASLKSPIAFLTGDGVNDLIATVDRQDVRALIRILESLDSAMATAVKAGDPHD